MTLASGRREKIADLIVWVSFFPYSVHKRFRILARLNKKCYQIEILQVILNEIEAIFIS